MNISAKRAKKLLSFRRLEEIGSRGWDLGSRREIGALSALSSYLIFPSPQQTMKARLSRRERILGTLALWERARVRAVF